MARLNFPNQLTLLRFFLAFVYVLLLSFPWNFGYTAALLCFIIASLTDWIDGMLARAWGQVTDFGKLMDPLADKVLICAAFVFLSVDGWIPAWMVVLIFAREYMVTGLRLLVAEKKKVLAAENLGKYKTILQVVCVLFFLLWQSSAEEGAFSFATPWFESYGNMCWILGQILIYTMLAITLLSGANYFLKNRQFFLTP